MEAECVVCWDNIDSKVSMTYHSEEAIVRVPIEGYCWQCVKNEIDTHFRLWEEKVRKADCQAAWNRAIADPPPMSFADVYIKRKSALALNPLLFTKLECGDETIPIHLSGAPQTVEARDRLWDELKEFKFAE